MKNLLDKGLIQIKGESYLNLLIFLVPFLNFLVGINIDLYAPSLPAISQYYDVSIMAAKNTITATMIGFAIGCILFGMMLDVFGRRRIILLSLSFYIITSFLALFSNSIHQLMIIRFVQGLTAAALSIGPRALIVDLFTGHRLIIGLMYTSLAYGLGPIIGPFIGGLIQFYFGWRANFLAYALFALILLLVFLLYVNESFHQRQHFSIKTIFTNYLNVLTHIPFLAAAFILGGIQLEQMIYPTLAPFLIEIELHQTAIAYGNTALLVGTGYLFGTLINRLIIKKFTMFALINFGFASILVGLMLQIGFALLIKLNIWTLVLPFIIMIFGTGFIFANILGQSLRLFPEKVGIAAAVLTCLIMVIAAFGLFIISYFQVRSLLNLSSIFTIIIIIQLLIFYITFVPSIKQMRNGEHD